MRRFRKSLEWMSWVRVEVEGERGGGGRWEEGGNENRSLAKGADDVGDCERWIPPGCRSQNDGSR